MSQPQARDEVAALRDGVDVVYLLLKKTIGILGAILVIPVFTLCAIMLVYLVALLLPEGQVNQNTTDKIHDLIFSIWERLVPVSTQIIKIIAPVLVLILALAGLNLINRGAGNVIRFGEVLSDLPSILAIIIVTTICLIPFTGGEIPQALSNVALVVVGFYFGKVQRRGSATTNQPANGATNS